MASLIGLTSDKQEFEKGDFLEYDSSVNVVVDFYGLVDLTKETSCEANDNVPPWTLQDFLGVHNTKDAAIKASAMTYVTETAPPFLILHGEEDNTVPIAQSEAFYQKLQQKGVDFEVDYQAGILEAVTYESGRRKRE